jgi:anthranilate synthase/aminodeoxychorismate synthase-like glutamine amidotransferase
MVLIIDNYDSFTYNLVQCLGELGANLVVRRNDAMTVDDIEKMSPEKIVISPGPGRPENAGISVDVIQKCSTTIPILGVCLGHQAISVAFGGVVASASSLMHGKSSRIEHDGKGVFAGVEGGFSAGRYHSLSVVEGSLPEELEVVARSMDDDTIMGLRHKIFPLHGVQFHPESVLTDEGKCILSNFLEL